MVVSEESAVASGLVLVNYVQMIEGFNPNRKYTWS